MLEPVSIPLPFEYENIHLDRDSLRAISKYDENRASVGTSFISQWNVLLLQVHGRLE